MVYSAGREADLVMDINRKRGFRYKDIQVSQDSERFGVTGGSPSPVLCFRSAGCTDCSSVNRAYPYRLGRLPIQLGESLVAAK
jgi:uncharacterized membrane protein